MIYLQTVDPLPGLVGSTLQPYADQWPMRICFLALPCYPRKTRADVTNYLVPCTFDRMSLSTCMSLIQYSTFSLPRECHAQHQLSTTRKEISQSKSVFTSSTDVAACSVMDLRGSLNV
ncbi:uncharacterized protein LAJ45_06659 [Morchella importuna]|uniref:uncharacterized protein n=1 Tax=Morchella importuna TaxID=1174673 RepID=UPI001E8DC6B6|nr:uncharacterized protein LAJ45_06659 [Morchella importuna]KAH8149120.1 hypothetical protein LAJ45_06659 [Morchella importuna]